MFEPEPEIEIESPLKNLEEITVFEFEPDTVKEVQVDYTKTDVIECEPDESLDDSEQEIVATEKESNDELLLDLEFTKEEIIVTEDEIMKELLDLEQNLEEEHVEETAAEVIEEEDVAQEKDCCDTKEVSKCCDEEKCSNTKEEDCCDSEECCDTKEVSKCCDEEKCSNTKEEDCCDIEECCDTKEVSKCCDEEKCSNTQDEDCCQNEECCDTIADSDTSSITLPASLTFTGKDIFEGCSSLSANDIVDNSETKESKLSVDTDVELEVIEEELLEEEVIEGDIIKKDEVEIKSPKSRFFSWLKWW